MPTGKPHKYFCGKKSWNIQCCLRRYLHHRKCPLDEKGIDGKDWHSIHNRKELIDLSAIEKPPTIDGCVKFLDGIFDKLEFDFQEFRSQFPAVSDNEIRLCWIAHLVADFACRYWCEGTGQQVIRNYGEIKDPRFWEFVTNVGKHFLPNNGNACKIVASGCPKHF